MNEAVKFMYWMIKIKNVHYTNDVLMGKALEKFRKPSNNVNITSTGNIR